MLKVYNYIILILFLFLLITGCTSNPFENDDISDSTRELTGKVTLSDNSAPDNVYIWLKGLNSSSWTDKNGDFKLRLPSGNQYGDIKPTGNFTMFYYVANYKIDSSSVVIRNGQLERGFGDVNEDGEIKETKILKKLVNVTTVATPSKINFSSDFWIYLERQVRIKVTLEALENNVNVAFCGASGGPLSYIFLQKRPSDVNYYEIINQYNTESEELNYIMRLQKGFNTWETTIVFYLTYMPMGQYNVIPYFLIMQPDVPSELIESLGADVKKPTSAFMTIPFKRSDGFLELRAN